MRVMSHRFLTYPKYLRWDPVLKGNRNSTEETGLDPNPVQLRMGLGDNGYQ